jgi:hypothetical protein
MIYFINVSVDNIEKFGSAKSASYALAEQLRQAWDNDYSIDYIHTIKVVNGVARIIDLEPLAEHLAGYIPAGKPAHEMDFSKAVEKKEPFDKLAMSYLNQDI